MLAHTITHPVKTGQPRVLCRYSNVKETNVREKWFAENGEKVNS